MSCAGWNVPRRSVPSPPEPRRSTIGQPRGGHGCDDADMSEAVQRYVAFSDDPEGGNPAGVVLEADGLSDDRMLEIAAELGYSETAFLFGTRIRYFSPLAEVPFCGHATIATAVALAERDGPGDVVLTTVTGPVPVTTRRCRPASATPAPGIP